MGQSLTQASQTHIDRLRDRRRTAEQLCELAEHLAPADRALVLQVLRHGQSMTEIARLRDELPRRTQRRMRSLLQRLSLPEFNLLAAHGPSLPEDVRAAATLVICRGHTLRQAASLSGQSLHHVREHVQSVRTLARLR